MGAYFRKFFLEGFGGERKTAIKLKNGIEISNYAIEETNISIQFNFEFQGKTATPSELMELFDPAYGGEPVILNSLKKKGWVDAQGISLIHFRLADSEVNEKAKKAYIRFALTDPWNPPQKHK